MTLTEVLPEVQVLSRQDQLRLIQLLAAGLSQTESRPSLEPGAEYPVWSPLDAHEAAETMLAALPVEQAVQ